MSTRFLSKLFNPVAVAVIGASDRPRSVGSVVMRNLLAGGLTGPIMPVNPKQKAVAGVMAYSDVISLPEIPDLAVICTPPPTVPGIIRNLGERGTNAAIVLTAGLHNQKDEAGTSLQIRMQEAARAHSLRILGPNCLGLMNPSVGLNASFAHAMASPGKVAFVTQSGALSTAILDYAKSNEIGLSCFVSLGNGADVDFGDLLDYLAADPNTGAILLYMESIKDAPKFMSAARAASMNKPVLAVKAGRVPEGARAAMSHTGSLAGSDDVFESALKRAGILRVQTIPELFDAVETLGLAKFSTGDRLAILTNGGGPAVMATDALVLRGGRLATLGENTVSKLDKVLPSTWSRAIRSTLLGTHRRSAMSMHSRFCRALPNAMQFS
jgi:acetyltransferase